MCRPHSNTFPPLLLSVHLSSALTCFYHTAHTLPHTCRHANVHTSLLALLSFQTRVYSRSHPHPCLSGTYFLSSQKSFDSPNGFAFQACACVSRHSFLPICWTFHLVKIQEPSCLESSLLADLYPQEISEYSGHIESIKKLVLISASASEAAATE